MSHRFQKVDIDLPLPGSPTHVEIEDRSLSSHCFTLLFILFFLNFFFPDVPLCFVHVFGPSHNPELYSLNQTLMLYHIFNCISRILWLAPYTGTIWSEINVLPGDDSGIRNVKLDQSLWWQPSLALRLRSIPATTKNEMPFTFAYHQVIGALRKPWE